MPERLIEAERGDHPCALDLIGVGADQDIDRIADCVNAEEHQQRHDQQDADALEKTTNNEYQHAVL